jgi:hypothetical protein
MSGRAGAQQGKEVGLGGSLPGFDVLGLGFEVLGLGFEALELGAGVPCSGAGFQVLA